MASWHVDEGLAVLIAQWKREHPGAVVYTVGDTSHQAGTSEHNPEKAGSAPGADAGEVDAADFMPSGGVTMDDLAELRGQLLDARDSRLLYVIFKNTIVSSVVSPWKVRPYNGKYHSHLHVSVNDLYAANRATWDLGEDKPMTYVDLAGSVPVLGIGSEDQAGKVAHIKRLQSIANGTFGADLDVDGVYGPRSAAWVASIMKDDDARTTSNGSKVAAPEWRRILGVW